MTTETPAGRYVRRRPTCLAMRVSEHNLAEVAAWAGGHTWASGVTWASCVVVPTMRMVDGQWRTGEHPAHVGDWVARLGDGRYQVLGDDEFRTEWMAAR